MPKLSRRDFLRFLTALSAAGEPSQLGGCGTPESTTTYAPNTSTLELAEWR